MAIRRGTLGVAISRIVDRLRSTGRESRIDAPTSAQGCPKRTFPTSSTSELHPRRGGRRRQVQASVRQLVQWPFGQSAYDQARGQVALPSWNGSLRQQARDATGFEFRRHRVYDPKTGRFTQEDPIGLAGGLNLYGFANGDPVNFSDPFGLCPECVTAGVQFFAALGSRAIDVANERKISRLGESVQFGARLFVILSSASGNPIRITQGLRTYAEQDALYAQGRTTGGEIVTNARGGQSYHNFGLAIDVAPVQGGRVNPNAYPSDRSVTIGKALGWEWGGGWRRFKDRPHFQMTGGGSLDELRRGQP